MAADLLAHEKFLLVFDPLGDDAAPREGRELDHVPGQQLLFGVAVDGAEKKAVDFDDVGAGVVEELVARIPGAEIIDRDAEPLVGVVPHQLRETLKIDDLVVFGEFDHEHLLVKPVSAEDLRRIPLGKIAHLQQAVVNVVEQLEVLIPLYRTELGNDLFTQPQVERVEDVFAVEGIEKGLDALESEGVGPPQQGLDAERRSRVDIDDRLEGDVEDVEIVAVNRVQRFHDPAV